MIEQTICEQLLGGRLDEVEDSGTTDDVTKSTLRGYGNIHHFSSNDMAEIMAAKARVDSATANAPTVVLLRDQEAQDTSEDEVNSHTCTLV